MFNHSQLFDNEKRYMPYSFGRSSDEGRVTGSVDQDTAGKEGSCGSFERQRFINSEQWWERSYSSNDTSHCAVAITMRFLAYTRTLSYGTIQQEWVSAPFSYVSIVVKRQMQNSEVLAVRERLNDWNLLSRCLSDNCRVRAFWYLAGWRFPCW